VLNNSNVLVLVNAIYFKGNWDSQFEARYTKDELFHVSSEKTVTTPLMRQTLISATLNFPINKYSNFRTLEAIFSMLVLLPRQADGLGNLEAELTVQNLAAWVAKLQSQKVAVSCRSSR